VFKVGGKSFVITTFEPRGHFLSFKASPTNFAELPEREGVVPAPYLARAQWLAVEREDAVPRAELRGWLSEAYELVRSKLPKKVQAGLK
jgi:predicted DNA-binding protein (MmcQ/YjbR family)